MAAEQDDRSLEDYKRLVFVGFGVLSAAEVKLFDHYKREGLADFWWDNAGLKDMLSKAPHDPGALLIDGYCKRFESKPLEPIDDADGPEIRAVAVASFCVLHETVDTEHGKPLDAADGLQRGDGLGVDDDEGGKEGQEREEACHDFSSSLLSEG